MLESCTHTFMAIGKLTVLFRCLMSALTTLTPWGPGLADKAYGCELPAPFDATALPAAAAARALPGLSSEFPPVPVK